MRWDIVLRHLSRLHVLGATGGELLKLKHKLVYYSITKIIILEAAVVKAPSTGLLGFQNDLLVFWLINPWSLVSLLMIPWLSSLHNYSVLGKYCPRLWYRTLFMLAKLGRHLPYSLTGYPELGHVSIISLQLFALEDYVSSEERF